MSYTWNVVDTVIAALVDKHIKETDDREKFAETYAAWKQRLAPVVRKRAFNRFNLALAVYHLAYRAAFNETLDIAALVDEANEVNFRAMLGPGFAIEFYPSSVNHAIVELKRETCAHNTCTTRTRVAITDDTTLSNSEFLALTRHGSAELYCVDCGKSFSVKSITFTAGAVLKAIRDTSRAGQEGALLKDVIERLKRDYIMCPRLNADPRKRQASEYMSLKVLLRPFVERGLMAIDDVARNKRVRVL